MNVGQIMKDILHQKQILKREFMKMIINYMFMKIQQENILMELYLTEHKKKQMLKE